MDVSVLRWPEQADGADRLARIGAPRLLLVESGVAAPSETSCVVAWVRLPVDGGDMRVRLAALAERAARHPSRPFVGDYGQVSHQGTAVFLPPVHERIARILIESSGRPVPSDDLIQGVWPQDRTIETLRGNISRLRHRIAPLGLTITHIAGHGYVMREAEATETTRLSSGEYGLLTGGQEVGDDLKGS